LTRSGGGLPNCRIAGLVPDSLIQRKRIGAMRLGLAAQLEVAGERACPP
jgi:hypothetical protein